MYVFFFKQKTAYEMRISDWSSDVCSSDLGGGQFDFHGVHAMNQPRPGNRNGPVAAFFIFVWDAMNFVRRLAFNILFFGLRLIRLIALALAGRVSRLRDEQPRGHAPKIGEGG